MTECTTLITTVIGVGRVFRKFPVFQKNKKNK